MQSEPIADREGASLQSAAEPSWVFIASSLWRPVSAVISLLLSLALCDAVFRGYYIFLAVLGFLVGGELVDVNSRGGWRAPDAYKELLDLWVCWLCLIGFLWLLLQVAGLADPPQLRILRVWLLLAPLLTWSAECAGRRALSVYCGRMLRCRHAVIVGATEVGARLEGELSRSPLLRTRVLGYFEDRRERQSQQIRSGVLGKTADLREFVRRNRVDIVYITLPMTRHPRTLGLVESLHDCTASLYFVPDLVAFNVIQARFDLVSDIPVVAVRESPFYGVSGAAKRVTDICIAALAITILAPVLLAVAAGVRLSSRGPVIFKQRRYGLDGRSIVIYKFRSMSVTEDGDRDFTAATVHDSRVTAFGRFIRRTSLDELPQLLNVLEGTMSIVGPRPHAVAMNEQFRRLIPGYMIRHKVKPGITGWAQINGYRGGDDLQAMHKRIEFDLEYLRHWSLAMDLMIILRTATLVWADRRAY